MNIYSRPVNTSTWYHKHKKRRIGKEKSGEAPKKGWPRLIISYR